jgi:hypothetical protein
MTALGCWVNGSCSVVHCASLAYHVPDFKINMPAIPVYANTTGRPYTVRPSLPSHRRASKRSASSCTSRLCDRCCGRAPCLPSPATLPSTPSTSSGPATR